MFHVNQNELFKNVWMILDYTTKLRTIWEILVKSWLIMITIIKQQMKQLGTSKQMYGRFNYNLIEIAGE